MDGRLRYCCGMQQQQLFDQPQIHCRACIESNLDTRMVVIVPASMTAAEFKDKVSRSHLQNFPEHGNVNVKRLMVMVCGYWYAFSEGFLGAVAQGPDARFKAELVLEKDSNRHEQQQNLHQDSSRLRLFDHANPQNVEVPCTTYQKERNAEPVQHAVPVRDTSPMSRDPMVHLKSPSQYQKDPSYTNAEMLESASHAADVVMNVLVSSSRKSNGRVGLGLNEERACEAQPDETGFTEREVDKQEGSREEAAEQEIVAQERTLSRSERETPKRKLDLPDRKAKRLRAGARSQNTDRASEKRPETGREVNSKEALDEFDKAVSEDATNRDAGETSLLIKSKVIAEATSGETKSKDTRSKEARNRDGLAEHKDSGVSSKETGVGDKEHESEHAEDKDGSTKRTNAIEIEEVSSGRTSKHADELANKVIQECERSKSRQTNSRQTERQQESDEGVSAGKDIDGLGNSEHGIDDVEECKKLEDMCQNLITQHFSYCTSSSRSGGKDQGGNEVVKPTSPDDSEASSQSSPLKRKMSTSGQSNPSKQDFKMTGPRQSGSQSSEDNEDQIKRRAEVSGKTNLGEEVRQVSADSERTTESGEKDDKDTERTSGVKLFRVESSTSSEKTSQSKRNEKENEQEQSEKELATSTQSKQKRSMLEENEASEDEAEGNKPDADLSTSSGKIHSKQKESQQEKISEPLSEAATQERFEPELSTSTTPSKQTNLPQDRNEEEEQEKLEELPVNQSNQKKGVQAKNDEMQTAKPASSSSEESEQIKHKKVNRKAKTANKKVKRRGRQDASSSSESYEPSKASSSSSDSSSTSEQSAPVRKNPRRGLVDSRLQHFVERSDALEELINIKLSKRMSAPADAPANGPDVVYETQTIEEPTPISAQETDKDENPKTVNAKPKGRKTKSTRSSKSVQKEAQQENVKKTRGNQKINGTPSEQEKPADNTASVATSDDNTEAPAKGKGSKKKPRQKADKEKKSKDAQTTSDSNRASRPPVLPVIPSPLDILKRKYAAETANTGTKRQKQAQAFTCTKGCGKVYSGKTSSYVRHISTCKGV